MKEIRYEYKARIYNVYDGDTFKAEIDLGFKVSLKVTLRLYGVDTPEIRGESREEGLKVRDRVRELILDQEVILRTYKGKEKGKYGRWLAEVFLLDGSLSAGHSLGDLLIEAGQAKSYFGGKRN